MTAAAIAIVDGIRRKDALSAGGTGSVHAKPLVNTLKKKKRGKRGQGRQGKRG